MGYLTRRDCQGWINPVPGHLIDPLHQACEIGANHIARLAVGVDDANDEKAAVDSQ